MDKFRISKDNEKISSINRTIRLKSEIYDKLILLSEQNGVSFNKLVNQCIDYALSNLEEDSADINDEI